MKDVKLIYETLLNEHRRITNQIADIKAQNFELNDQQKRTIQSLQERQVLVMNQMKKLFDGNLGK